MMPSITPLIETWKKNDRLWDSSVKYVDSELGIYLLSKWIICYPKEAGLTIVLCMLYEVTLIQDKFSLAMCLLLRLI